MIQNRNEKRRKNWSAIENEGKDWENGNTWGIKAKHAVGMVPTQMISR